MPISSNASAVDRKRTFKVVNKVLTPSGASISTAKLAPAQGATVVAPNPNPERNCDSAHRAVTLQAKCDGTICAHRADKDVRIDRLNLDRCSLGRVPLIVDDHNHLRLFSLQHNVIASLAICQAFPNLVFLDLYDNEIEQIDTISTAPQLRVLLIGKNRLRKMGGLAHLTKLEVLDLHGNEIAQVCGLSALCNLKVLNMAGNRIGAIADGDLRGLDSLRELNLRRNTLKKMNGFEDVAALQKLYLSNNDIKRMDDMITIMKCVQLRELTMDNNPVSVTSDCVSFLVAQLSSLTSVNGVAVTENFRKSALVWKRNKLQGVKSAPLLNGGGREKVISNAKTNWELLRTQTKCLTAKQNHPPHKYAIRKQTPPPTKQNNFAARANSCDTTDSSSLSNNSTNNVCCFLPPILHVATETKQQTTTPSDSSDCSAVSSNPVDICDSSPHLDENDDSLSARDNNNVNNDIKPPDDLIAASIAHAPTDGATGAASTASELSRHSAIKCRRGVRSALVANTLTRGRLGKQSRAASVKVSKCSSRRRSPSTGSSSTGFNPTASTTSNITYQGAPILLPTTTNTNTGGGGAVGGGGRDREQGGDYLVEISGRHLNVYGQGALRHVDKAWSPARAADVTHVNFHYANYNGIAAVLPRLKHRFPNISQLSFTGNSLTHLGQLNALAEVQGLHALVINADGNPLVANSKWRQYAIYRLGHWGLKMINGEEVSIDEDIAANAEFHSLGSLVLYTLPDAILEPLLVHLKLNELTAPFCKRQLLLADPNLRSVITKEALQWKRSLNSQDEFALRQRSKLRISAIVDEMAHSQMKLRELERSWPSIFRGIIQNCLLDYTQFDSYKKAQLNELVAIR